MASSRVTISASGVTVTITPPSTVTIVSKAPVKVTQRRPPPPPIRPGSWCAIEYDTGIDDDSDTGTESPVLLPKMARGRGLVVDRDSGTGAVTALWLYTRAEASKSFPAVETSARHVLVLETFVTDACFVTPGPEIDGIDPEVVVDAALKDRAPGLAVQDIVEVAAEMAFVDCWTNSADIMRAHRTIRLQKKARRG